MNSINLILFLIIVNGIWAQTQAKRLSGKSSSISCINDEHCITFLGAGTSCKNHVCVCEDEELCKPHKTDARIKSNVIGEDCADDYNCNIQFSVCTEGYCTCIPEKVASNDGRKCLNVSDGLGDDCEQDIQCIRKIQGSVCREFKCVCDEFHHQDSSDCFEKVGLGQTCTVQSQCSHIYHAHCGKVFCDCDAGFVESDSRVKCLPEATQPLDKCEESQQCHRLGHASICMYGRCECDSVHRMANASACPTRLKQFCTSDDECKSDMDDSTMYCDMGRCECKLPFFEQNGVCNGSGNTKYAVSSVIPILMFILILYYK